MTQVAGQQVDTRRFALRETAQDLRQMVTDLTVEDFRIEDYRFERDARLGRELLFLLSNNEWARRTTEVIEVGRVRAVDVEVVVDVDPAFIQHEAFRPAGEVLCLPVLALPADRPSRPGRPGGAGGPGRPGGLADKSRWRRPGQVHRDSPDPITSLEVVDAAGARVTKVPQADVHHWLAAALAETLQRQLRRPGKAGRTAADPRDQVVLLAASIRRLLQRTLEGPGPDELVPRPAEAGASGLRRFEGRVRAARAALLDVFGTDLDLPRPVLTSRVMEMLYSLVDTVLVVVSMERASPATSFTVRLPSRKLVRERSPRWRLVPRARLRVDLAVATSHADRLIRLNLPPEVTWAASEDLDRPDVARIEVRTPLPFDQLRTLIDQIVDSDERETWVDRRLAELAMDKVDACLESLRYYQVPVGSGGSDRQVVTGLGDLREALLDVAAEGSSRFQRPRRAVRPPRRALRELWRDGAWLPRRMHRRLIVNVASPDAVQVRAPAIEDFTQRAEPTGASLDLDVTVTDSTVLDSARDTNAINLVLLTAVTALLLWHNLPHPGRVPLNTDVLATILTLFPAIQASRIERPDVTTLAGLLTQPGYWLSLATAVPATLLAATTAVVEESVAVPAAVLALAVQLLLHLLIVQRASGRPAWRPHRTGRGRFVLSTGFAPDHKRFDVLRSTWCRTLTADALKLGRPAHASIVLGADRPGSFADLLRAAQDGEQVLNLLAGFSAGAAGNALTMLVFRDGAARRWRPSRSTLVQPVDLDLARLVPPDPPEWIVEVLIGIPVEQARTMTIAKHPLRTIVGAARDNNFRAVLVQYPAAPPRTSRAGREWMRVRIGVPYRRYDSLNGLRRFLSVLREVRVGGYEMEVQIVPEMPTLGTTETAPEENFYGSASPERLRPVLRAEVETPAPDDDGAVWRPIALCANARVGVVSEALDSLARHRPGLRLAAASSAVVHALSVTFLLCRDPDPKDPDGGRLGQLVVEDLAATDEVVAPIDGRQMPPPSARSKVVRQLPVSVPGPRPRRVPDAPRPGPLLLVQVRAADRPRMVQQLLSSLDVAVRAQGMRLGIAGHDQGLDVWNCLVRVVDGRTLQGRLTVRLPSDHDPARDPARDPADDPAEDLSGGHGWDGVDWARVAGRVHDTAALGHAAVLTLDLLRINRVSRPER
jgi:hypothetical protein